MVHAFKVFNGQVQCKVSYWQLYFGCYHRCREAYFHILLNMKLKDEGIDRNLNSYISSCYKQKWKKSHMSIKDKSGDGSSLIGGGGG